MVNEELIEKVETQLHKLIDEKSEQAIIFFLKTIGSRHGFGNSIDINLHSSKIHFKFGNDDDSIENPSESTDNEEDTK